MIARLAPVVVAATLALAPGVARAAIPIVMYPFRVPELSAAQRADMHGILEAALSFASRRGILAPRSPVLLAPSCGDYPSPECLAGAAKGALVLTGRGVVRGGVVSLTAAVWDSKGSSTREVKFVVDLVIQNMRPVGAAILELELEVGPDGRIARFERPSAPAPAAADRAAAARVPMGGTPAAPGARWKRKAGPWLTGVGVALLAGGAAVGLANRELSDDLDARYANGRIGTADRSSYDRVKTYNVLSTALFAAGGAATAVGAWIWISAPAEGGRPAAVGAGGRF
jgi:hypothetical protein